MTDETRALLSVRPRPRTLTAAVPSVVVGPLTEEFDGVLLWMQAGSAEVVAARTTYRLTAGRALWIPPGIEHKARADPGSVVFPFLIPPTQLPEAGRAPRMLRVPRSWEEWMVHCWDDNSSVREAPPDLRALGELFASDAARRQDVTAGSDVLPLPAPMPRSAEALEVARELVRRPGSPQGIDWYAARCNVSAKTLQRQFLRDTGVPFARWRVDARLALAASHLAAGRPVGETGRLVGYRTPAGFTRAFRSRVGLVPRDYARVATSTATGVMASEHSSPDPREDPASRPTVIARSQWSSVSAEHELMWVYRGRVQLRVGPRKWSLNQGEAIWVPAGVTRSAEFAEGALMLTVGIAHGRVRAGVDDLRVLDLTAMSESLLLHAMISEYTALQPESGDGTFVQELFRQQFPSRAHHRNDAAGALGEIARGLRRNPADSRSLADWASQLRVTPADLSREFMTQAGETFPRWRARIRMDIARERLRSGDSPGQALRGLGFASPGAFTRAFTTAHGLSPREYARR